MDLGREPGLDEIVRYRMKQSASETDWEGTRDEEGSRKRARTIYAVAIQLESGIVEHKVDTAAADGGCRHRLPEPREVVREDTVGRG